ncbi:hypothetical protein TNCV_1607421 [Trichonephila clavipes]|nr:hypothetical protein TNCV_1607421 [Trichonephila clavipes]
MSLTLAPQSRCTLNMSRLKRLPNGDVWKGLKLSDSTFRIPESDEANMKEDTDYKYLKSTQTAQELILRIDDKSFTEITILLEHSDKNGTIPKSNPHLLHAELKNKIPRHDKITHMYFTRSGKIKISSSDPICAVQITAIEQILNIPKQFCWNGDRRSLYIVDELDGVPRPVGRWDSRSTFLRSDWPRPFTRRKVGVEMDWVDPKINDVSTCLFADDSAMLTQGRNSPLSLENKVILYKQVLRPIITYASPVWGAAAATHMPSYPKQNTPTHH